MEAIVPAGKMSSHSDRQTVWVHIDGISTRLLYNQERDKRSLIGFRCSSSLLVPTLTSFYESEVERIGESRRVISFGSTS